jgi:hypothetical protein
MHTANTTTVNPVAEALSTEELQMALEARGLTVKAPKAKAEKVATPEKSDAEILVDALAHVVTVVDGKLVVSDAVKVEKSDAATLFEALSLKARTTTEKIEKAKRPAYTGAKRGPKAKSDAAAPEVK